MAIVKRSKTQVWQLIISMKIIFFTKKNSKPLMYKPTFNSHLSAIFFCFFIGFLGNMQDAVGQVQPNLGQTSRLMREALTAMEANDYQTANVRFRQIIDSNAPIPPEMPYYFAE